MIKCPSVEHFIYQEENEKRRPHRNFNKWGFDNEFLVNNLLTNESNGQNYKKFKRPVVCSDTNDKYRYENESSYNNESTKGIFRENVVRNLTAIGRFLEILQTIPLPCLSFTTACILFVIGILISPRSCVVKIIFPAFRLLFGTLYPAYASYKAVRTKNVKEYVKWMMYWIVYAFFTCTETFTDIFLSWFPFYYEVKVVIVFWLLSPATKGSSTLYRKFVHPMLTRREQEIDDYLNQAKERGYSAVLQFGSKGVNYATNVIMQTALKTFHYGLIATNNQLGMLPSSQSDDIIYARGSIRNESELDTIDNSQWVARSSSLNSMVSFHVEFSEDDEQIFDTVMDEEQVISNYDIGAARIRGAPKRKIKVEEPNGSIKKFSELLNHTSNVNTARIRPRRKLREATPDIDVDVE